VSISGGGMTFTWNEGELRSMLRGPTGHVARDLLKRGYRVRSRAIMKCPVGTPETTHKAGYVGGRLRSSIVAVLGTDSLGIFVMIGSNVEYALFVHEGTIYMVGRPFLTSSLSAANT
jgi:hypothetical protein